MAGSLHCQLLSPEGSVFDGQVSFVEAHALDGRVGDITKPCTFDHRSWRRSSHVENRV